MSNLARIIRSRDAIVETVASAILLSGSATGRLPFSTTEALGSVTGALSVWLLVRQSIWTWPAGVANGIFFLVLFAQARFFADSALQVVFIALGLWGWWYWLHGGRSRSPRPIGRIRFAEAAALLAFTELRLSEWRGTGSLRQAGVHPRC